MGVHKVEKGIGDIGGGVVFRWVVIYLVAENGDASVELEFGIGGVGGVLVGTVVRGGLRQVWRGGGKVEFEAIVDGEVWGAVGLILVVYIVMAVHGGGGVVRSVTCAASFDPFGWLCTEDRDEDWRQEEEKKADGKRKGM